EARVDRAGNAAVVLQYLSCHAPDSMRRRAASDLEILQGRGSFGGHAEFLVGRIAKDAIDPISLAGMASGGAVFPTARAALFARLLASPGVGAAGARILASTGAFLLEVPSFWATTRGLGAWTGSDRAGRGGEAWRELAGLGISLGALRLTGLAADRIGT